VVRKRDIQVSLSIVCDCGTKSVITPPASIQESPKDLRKFDLHCCYCQGFIGNFVIDLEE